MDLELLDLKIGKYEKIVENKMAVYGYCIACFCCRILFYWIVKDYNGKITTSESNKKIEHLINKCDSLNKELIFVKQIDSIHVKDIEILDKTIELMNQNR